MSYFNVIAIKSEQILFQLTDGEKLCLEILIELR